MVLRKAEGQGERRPLELGVAGLGVAHEFVDGTGAVVVLSRRRSVKAEQVAGSLGRELAGGADERLKDPEVGKAIPCGVYDVGANEGFVSVGDDADTAAFAVAIIRRWWDEVGRLAYPGATRLLITADAGGSNGYRDRLWKLELGRLADDTGLRITVCSATSLPARPSGTRSFSTPGSLVSTK